MLRFTRTSLIAMLVLALAPAALTAQETPPTQPQVSPEVQGWLVELQQIQAELEPVQEQALQDPSLQQEQQQVSVALQEAMVEIDPAISQQTQRIQELRHEAQAAQEAEDMNRVIELSAEAQEIQQRIMEVQAEAIQHPEVAPQVEAFQAKLQARMIEIDPEAEARIQRMGELERRLETALRQQSTP